MMVRRLFSKVAVVEFSIERTSEEDGQMLEVGRFYSLLDALPLNDLAQNHHGEHG